MNRQYQKCLKAYYNIESVKDLNGEQITLSDYFAIREIISYRKGTTISLQAKKWFERLGCFVKDLVNGCFYVETTRSK